MARSRKTNLARSARTEIDEKSSETGGLLAAINQFGDLWVRMRAGGRRWGNQRKMRAELKVKERRIDRAKSKTLPPLDE